MANIVLENQSFATPADHHDFTGSFDGHEISGTLSCDGGTATCRLSDNQGALSEWLMRYSNRKESQTGWPSLLVQGDHGYALKIVTTVGLVELHRNPAEPDDTHFRAEIGNGRALVIRFSEFKQSLSQRPVAQRQRGEPVR